LARDSAPVLALTSKAAERARRSFSDWRKWEKGNLKKAFA
jgi:hypothetical protein